jgi:hypothetical protein
MRKLLLLPSALLLALLASVALAKIREPIARTLILSEHPRNEAPSVYVGGLVSTVLRLEKPCDSARTKMLSWEGHFEPLICQGKSVVLYPLRDLTSEDRFMLLVTLTDGTEIPFIVTSHQQSSGDHGIDQQVNVFADREGYQVVLAALYRALKSERVLREENERYRQEENSTDHAYATLLANGAVRQTPFSRKKTFVLKDGGVDVVVKLYSGEGKAAALVQITNADSDEPWRFGEARLTSDQTSRTARPFAFRMNRAEIVPGASGTIAVVVDKSAFESKQGLVDLTLEILRNDGLQQVMVSLDHRLTHK